MESITALLKNFDSIKDPAISLIEKVIKALRKSKIRRPDIIASYGPKLIKYGSFRSGELFSYYETIFTAALDHGDFKLADSYLQLLMRQFPDSSRVKRLIAMSLEFQGDYSAALGLYEEILKETPTNLLVLKRKVAIFKAQGDYKRAVECLHEILKVYQADGSCWMELADIHITLCDYAAAVYCLEELVLLAPMDALIHIRLADALYTTGGVDNLVKARKHYSISLNIKNPRSNTRALYGLLATCGALLTLSKKLSSTEENITAELGKWAQERLAERRSASSEVVQIVSSAIVLSSNSAAGAIENID
mmetsp:Transcript_1832/g.2905  ORF Transcript_1832/g.2905 Transcript_1832/m.2905 type:complete len:307 (-) Transcript_1832:138-1058(-)|eukprot:CAMPEP_0185030248 /NCGR_PEP_ID=MMETSP1103-20130426/17091_1 /TAXON_ID=36769 /ORGANISM="Paraphysomonas bandaiensis, Strain Caron Lab Isolate" /LENGTH=306 /DNA_ID=CAMNT_0027565297 /DNA_START=12 /DNA_END=932 /DNA_ORIENTATION=+